MIAKELDAFHGSDKFLMAGRRAEEQMAHYLRRFFGNSPHIDVLNYLRIELAGEVAQIDHLVVHPLGLTIVESKSVAGGVEIKPDGQWIRWFDKRPQGMRSPVTQARMQAMLLRDTLSIAVKQKGFFDSVELDVLVAISDSGTIKWPDGGPLTEVCKADQVPEKILQRLAAAREPILNANHRLAIVQFLTRIHKPLGAVEAGAPRASATPPAATSHAPVAADAHFGSQSVLPAKACKACRGTNLEARYGKFGYYFACAACSENTRIKFACPSCGEDGRIRKDGKQFFAECKSCSASSLYHTNQ